MKLADLSDEELFSSLEAICVEGHRLLARLIAHLIEVEERRLHLKAACSSLFDFCIRRLGLSEGAAFRRINAARLVQRYPCLLGPISRGEIHLSTLVLMRDHFTEANVDELVAAASGRSRSEVEELLARRAPRADVPSTIRKLPGPTAANATQSLPSQGASAPTLEARPHARMRLLTTPVAQADAPCSSETEPVRETFDLARRGLVSMGFREADARRAVGAVSGRHPDAGLALPIQQIFREALAVLTGSALR